MKKFYDIHMHAFDLSHPNLLAFIKRDGLLDKNSLTNVILDKLKWYVGLGYSLKWMFPKLIRRKVENIIEDNLINGFLPRIVNTLSIYENPIEYQFLILDYFLKHKEPLINANNELKIGNEIYERIVLCPLLMDFGKKNIEYNDAVFYNETPQKPIKKQVEDILNAIRIYYSHSLIKNKEGKMQLEKDNVVKEKLFEIYPFMGLNTKHYTLEKLKKLLDKYFSGYENDTQEVRKRKLQNKLGQFKNDIDDDGDFTYFFAGIKVYPPLDFNPWPKEKIDEFEKVKYLYEKCEEKSIPIMTHCSGGGFSVLEKSKSRELTNPETWSEVLSNYTNLKLCFAHFGSLKGEDNELLNDWRNKIIELTNKYNHVYTDFSCSEGDEYYKELSADINREGQTHLINKILFGTDFSINLFSNKNEKSYNGYRYRK